MLGLAHCPWPSVLAAGQVTTLLHLAAEQDGKAPSHLAKYYGVCEKDGRLCIVMDLYPSNLISIIPQGAHENKAASHPWMYLDAAAMYAPLAHLHACMLQVACPPAGLCATLPRLLKAWCSCTAARCCTWT